MHRIVYFLPVVVAALVLTGISSRKGHVVFGVAGSVVLVIVMLFWLGILR